MKHGFDSGFACPLPLRDYPQIVMAHGGGGRLTQDLIDHIFRPAFANAALEAAHDGAIFESTAGRLAFTTDSYVVRPLFFPGGDIGSLAVHGTVNDLAMCGARPVQLSLALIIEEGFRTTDLIRIAKSAAQAAREAGVTIATGDTKVVERGKGDGLYINTSGVGLIAHDLSIAPGSVRPGDVILLSGDLGRHGIAVMAQREGLSFETTIESDSAPLAGAVLDLLASGIDLHCLRDLTRGGLATALNEIARTAAVDIEIDETAVPVHDGVAGACELLGLDPLYVANEGRFIVILPAEQAPEALSRLRATAVAHDARLIGTVAPGSGVCAATGAIGGSRVLDLLSGEQLPRIC